MAAIKKNDFVEIDYTGFIKEDNSIFDTTQEKVAKDNGVYSKDAAYSPIVVCIGKNSMLEALEEQLIGKEPGKEYAFEINSDNAFGRRNAKLIQLISMGKFKQQNIQPFPGLQLNIDGVFGIVKTVSSGRCLVDFNHPLAGKDIVYKVKVNKIIEDDKEKVSSLLKMHGIDAEASLDNDTANITLKHKLAKGAEQPFKDAVHEAVPSIKNVVFTIPEEKKETKNK